MGKMPEFMTDKATVATLRAIPKTSSRARLDALVDALPEQARPLGEALKERDVTGLTVEETEAFVILLTQ